MIAAVLALAGRSWRALADAVSAVTREDARAALATLNEYLEEHP